MDNIKLIVTGGTIDSDKDYDFVRCVYKKGAKSRIVPYIEKFIKPSFNVNETVICLLDSGDLTEEHLSKILSVIKASKEKNIIVTHGTDTVVQSALFIDKNLKTDKRIIFVGAIFPLSFDETDAPFNLGFAFGTIEHLKPGVYIAMNAEVFKANEVVKNFKTMRFERIDKQI